MKKEKEFELPDWFEGELYKEGGEVTNPYSGTTVYLTPVELSMYDFVKGCEMICSVGGKNQKIEDDFYKALWWFKDNSPKNYMTLLD